MDIEDIFGEILKRSCITSVRNLLRTCKLFGPQCTNEIISLEKEYKRKYELLYSSSFNFGYTLLAKYTRELIIDNVYDLIPERYYNKNNSIMCSMLAFRGNLDLLMCAYLKRCPIIDFTYACAVYGGHIYILEWLKFGKKLSVTNCLSICNVLLLFVVIQTFYILWYIMVQ